MRKSAEPARAYDLNFFLTYLANVSLILGMSITFRYADFVSSIDGTEWHLGWIAGIGMVGAFSMRIFQCYGVGQSGIRRVWLVSLVAFIVGLLGHTWITSIDNPLVFVCRMMMTAGIAGAHGASMAHIAVRAPRERLAEMIGTVGSSGFVGMMFGPTLADWIFGDGSATRTHVDQMFYVAAAMGFVSLMCAWVASRGDAVVPRRRAPVLSLVRRYHPGILLLVGVAMGLAISMPGVFLRAYTSTLGIDHIRTFFIGYAIAAFVVRLASRRLPDRLGSRPLVLMGLSFLSLSMLLYLVVRSEWMLLLPGIAGGVAHAFLFPAVVAGGSRHFPLRYRALGTSLMLVVLDTGSLIGQPLVGGLIDGASRWGLSGYPTMFVMLSCGLATVAVVYGLATRTQTEPSESEPVRVRRPAGRQVDRREPERISG